jgi:hypothetical protein
MQMVREGIVDRVDFWIGKQRFIRSVGLRDAKLHGGCPGPLLVPGCDRDDIRQVTRLHGRDDVLSRDFGGA